MKQLNRLILVLVAGLMLAQCSTYKIKPDMNKSGVVNKTPKWYVDYNHETMLVSGGGDCCQSRHGTGCEEGHTVGEGQVG